jgi:putative transposase
MYKELRERDEDIGRDRVARLMRANGIQGVSRRKGTRTTVRAASTAAPDRVERDFTADGPDKLWVADLTYVPTWAGFVFLAVVIDVWSRKVVGWAMASHMRTDMVLDALNMAISQRDPAGVIFHSDKGSQYTSLAFGKRCELFGIELSTGSTGDCYDNALAESFFASLECELIDRSVFRTHAEARIAIFEYIEGWYNPHRRHKALNQVSPVNFERLHEDAQRAA